MATHPEQPKTISEIELPFNPNLPLIQHHPKPNSQPPSDDDYDDDDDEFVVSRKTLQRALEAPKNGIQRYETENTYVYTLTVPEINKDEVQVKVEKSCWYNPFNSHRILVIEVNRKRFFDYYDGKRHRSLRFSLSVNPSTPLDTGIRSCKNMRVNVGGDLIMVTFPK